MPVTNPVPFSGVSGNVSFGGTAYGVREWKASVDADVIKVTSTADGGWRTHITGPVGLEGSAKLNVDATTFIGATIGPQATLVSGTAVVAMVLALGSSLNTISFNARITKLDVSNPAEEEVTVEISFVSTGVITGVLS